MRKKLLIPLGLILVVCSVAFFLVSHGSAPPRSQIPHLTSIKFDDFAANFKRQKLTLVNVWASWCEPCRDEFPTYLKLRKQTEALGLRTLFLSIDQGSELEEAGRFLDSQKVDFETFNAEGPPAEFLTRLDPNWPGAVPTTFILNSTGRIVDSWLGVMAPEEIEKRVHAALTAANR